MANKSYKKNIIGILFIFLVLLIGIFHIGMAYAQATVQPVAAGKLVPVSDSTGTASSAQATPPNAEPVSVPFSAKEALEVGDKVLTKADGTPADKKDVTIKGATIIPEPFANKNPNGGKITIGGKDAKDSKIELGAEGDAKIKDNEIKKAAAGSSVEFDNKGNIKEAKIIGTKDSSVKISGKTKDTEILLSEGSILKKDKELTEKEKAPVYDVQLKEGSILEKPKTTKREKKEENDADPYFKFNGINIGLSDAMSEQFGLPKNTRFTGLLAMDSNGNFYTDKGSKGITFLDADGKTPVVRAPDLADKYGNVNDKTYFFNRENWNSEQGKLFKDNGGGAAVVMDAKGKYMSSLSTNEKLGAYIELSEGNPFNGYHSAIMPDKLSEVSIQGGGARAEVKLKGDGIFYAGEGVGFKKQGDELFFKKGAKIEDIFGESNSREFGLKFDKSKNYNADVYSLNKDGNPISDQKRNIYVRSGISDSGAITNQAFPLSDNNPKGVPVANPGEPRVQQNEAPKGKGANPSFLDRIKGIKNILPGSINTPVLPAQPTTPATVNPAPITQPPAQSQAQMPQAATDLLRNIRPSAQQVNVPLSNGQSIPLFGTEGNYKKALVIVASQPGCAPCIALAKQLKGTLPQGVQIVTIDITQNPNLVRSLSLQGRGTPTAVQIEPNTGKGMRMVTGSQSIYNFIKSL